MKVSLSWLSQYTPVRLSPTDLAEALTRVGLAVDAVVDRFAFMDTVRVGRVVSVDRHPAADRLTICRVDTGPETIQIVCGAPNVRAGALAAVALPGTAMPDGTTLAAGVLRGQRSDGMLCSAAELTVGADADGILVLEEGLSVGTPLNRALGLSDPVLEIDLTPNRADCLSIIGVARETAALQRTRLTLPDVRLDESDPPAERLAAVTIEAPDHCPRYAARVIEGVRVGPSPHWLQDRLRSIGLRPINNLVDVTNFVMMELGQPLHAFDLDRLAGRRIVVRTAAAGERFTTLDGRERVLEADMLMICDAEKPVAIAGVMGGQNSEIAEGTTRVLIESARFDPVSVRRTSKRLGLATDASRRFERGVDPVGAVTAADRAAMLMAEVAGGRIARGAIDAHPRPWMPQPIRLSVQSTHRLLGTRVPKNRIARLLAGIGFTVEPAPERDVLSVTAPSFRVDVGRPEDLMEEVARLAGFDTIPVTFPALPAGARTEAPRIALRRRARTIMNGCGFSEVITYSFVHAESCNRLRLAPDDPGRRTVPVLNPLAEDQSIMRPSLLPGLLETLRFNLAQQTRRVKVFEIGKVYHGRAEGELPDEPEFVAGLWCGPRRPPAWDEKDVPCDFYDAKGAIESLADGLKLEDLRFERLAPDDAPMLRPGHSARITASGRAIGRLGEVHPEVRKAYDLKQTAFVFELDLAAVEALVSAIRFRMQIPRFPAVSRDITLIVDGGLQAQAVQDAIAAMHVPHLERVQLVAVFTGDPIPAGKRSLSFRLTYRSPDQTLEDGEVNAVQQAVADRLLSELPASMSG